MLLLLQAREPESQQQTAERLQVDRTTMVALLDGLEAKDLVARQADPDDRRRNVIALTDVGRRTLEKAVRASDKAERRLLGALDESERKQLRALLAPSPQMDTERLISDETLIEVRRVLTRGPPRPPTRLMVPSTGGVSRGGPQPSLTCLLRCRVDSGQQKGPLRMSERASDLLL